MTTQLSGKERVAIHLGSTVSLDDIKAYLIKAGLGAGVATESDTIIKVNAGTNLGGQRIVVQINGLLDYAYYNNLDHMNKVVGITTASYIAGQLASVQFRGYMEDPSWHWSTDAPIFVGSQGIMTQAVPTVGFVQQVATVITPVKILINIQEPIWLGE